MDMRFALLCDWCAVFKCQRQIFVSWEPSLRSFIFIQEIQLQLSGKWPVFYLFYFFYSPLLNTQDLPRNKTTGKNMKRYLILILILFYNLGIFDLIFLIWFFFSKRMIEIQKSGPFVPLLLLFLTLGAVRVHPRCHPGGVPVWRDRHPSQRVCANIQRHTEGWHSEQHVSAQRRVPGDSFQLRKSLVSSAMRKERSCQTCMAQINFTVKYLAWCLFTHRYVFVRCLELCQIIVCALKDNSDSNLFVFYTESKAIDVSLFLPF